MRLDVASLLCERGLGSVCEWLMGLLPGSGIFVGFAVSVGVDSLSLRSVVVLSGCRLGLDAEWWVVRREQHDGADREDYGRERERRPLPASATPACAAA